MTKTRKPSKQRKQAFSAALHEKQKMLNVHLSRELRKKLKRRALGVRKDDKVKVMRGKFRGKDGKVSSVDHKKLRVFISGFSRKKVNGTEKMIPFNASNLLLMEIETKDEKRFREK
jgi:large subunit ribosomal protein L24